MSLNYNKWDSLQLSDDSDIEVHPNVDKKSMIRWKQRDIHEKRDLRKLNIKHLNLETIMNDSLLLRIHSLQSSLAAAPSNEQFIGQEIARLRDLVPNYDAPPKLKDGEQPSEDHMILSLLSQVVNAVRKLELAPEKREGALRKEVDEHEERLVKRQKDIVAELAREEKELKRYITSDDLHMGFESKTMISSTPSAVPQGPPKASSSSGKNKETKIETINSPSTSLLAPPASTSDSEDEAEDVPLLTPSALRFSLIAPLDFPKSFAAISADPSLLSEATTDALLVEAFTVAMKGDDKRAREFVEKGLLIQYCARLGRDGVALFFRRMTSSDPKALNIFLGDISSTSERIIARARVVAQEKVLEDANTAGGEEREQIQLVAADETQVITFEIPDGPPPADLQITGEGSESFDPVLVRQFLQQRWDFFSSFTPALQKALRSTDLVKVNKVLGRMSVEEAEKVVEMLQEGGMLAFEKSGVEDRTGRAEAPGGEMEVEDVEGAEEVEGKTVIVD